MTASLELTISHLMWQPFFRCMRECPGCYMWKYSHHCGQDNRNGEYLVTHLQLLSAILDGTVKIQEELVLSVDSQCYFTTGEVALFRLILSLKKVGVIPSLQIAVRDYSTLQRLLQFCGPLDCVDTFSFSSLPTIEEIHSLWNNRSIKCKVSINWNLLATQENLQHWSDHRDDYWYDTIHLILKKLPLALRNTRKTDLAIYNTMLDILRVDVKDWQKLRVDLCHAGTYYNLSNYPKEKNKSITSSLCTQNIHVWPNGCVTNCPYDSYLITTPRTKKDNIVEEISILLANPHSLVQDCQLW